jgi:hypothetical protein
MERARKTSYQCPPEKDEQSAFAAWLRLNGYVFCYVPNDMPITGRGGKPNFGWLNSAIKRGLQPGMPDYLIFGDAKGRPLNVAIEMKRVKGGKASENQERMLYALKGVNWNVYICHGAQEAMCRLDYEKKARGYIQ